MKNTYIVKQVAIPKEEQELPNQKGWDGAIAESDHWRVKMDYSQAFKDGGFKSEDLKYFTDTYKVEADCLESVFRITNLWEEDESVERFRIGHSTSVGDLIEDTSTGKIHMVRSYGFQEVA